MKFLSHLTKSLLILSLYSSPISGAAIADNEKSKDSYEVGKTYEFDGEMVFIKYSNWYTTPTWDFFFKKKDSQEYFSIEINLPSKIECDIEARFELKMVGYKHNLPSMRILKVTISKKDESGGDSKDSAVIANSTT